jgi:hypothetical protein
MIVDSLRQLTPKLENDAIELVLLTDSDDGLSSCRDFVGICQKFRVVLVGEVFEEDPRVELCYLALRLDILHPAFVHVMRASDFVFEVAFPSDLKPDRRDYVEFGTEQLGNVVAFRVPLKYS